VVIEVSGDRSFDYFCDYLRLLDIYRFSTYILEREQFWGRAALAPEILIGSGRFCLCAQVETR